MIRLRYYFVILFLSYCLFLATARRPLSTKTRDIAIPTPSTKSHEPHATNFKISNTHETPYLPSSYIDWLARPGQAPPIPTARSTLFKYGARVACWSSTGGIWIKHADLVDMNFLNLHRRVDTPRQFNETAEAEFCRSLKMVGADWYTLPPSFSNRKDPSNPEFKCATLETCFEPEIKFGGLIAWPETEKVACYVSMEKALGGGDEAMNKYYNSMDMQERCEAIMSMGGMWCKYKEWCPAIRDMDWGDWEPGPDACFDAPLTMYDGN